MNNNLQRIERQHQLQSSESLPYEWLKGNTVSASLRAMYADDPDAFWAYYRANAEVIDRYWGHVNAGAVINDLLHPHNPYVAGAIGFAAGATALYLYQQYSK